MSQISTRASAVALVKKNNEGTLTRPTAGGQYIAIQPDFALSPNFESVENAEIKDDIMTGQAVISGEAPTGTMSHYFKGSGTAGAEPDFGPMLASTFGSTRSQSTEGTLTAGSTTSVLKMSAADAARYTKGDSILIKDDVNGHSIRPVVSSSGTDVTLAFNLDTAPATGVKVGVYTTYAPTNTDLPVYDVWHYIGGGKDGLETMKDCRTVTSAITANAKENINCTFSFEGTAYSLNDVDNRGYVITTSNDNLRLQYGTTQSAATGGGGQFTSVDLDEAFYTPTQLAAHIQTKVRALTITNNNFSTFRCAYSASTKKFTFTPASSAGTNNVQSIGLRVTGSNATDPELVQFLGFDAATNIAAGVNGAAFTSPNETVGNYENGLDAAFDATTPIISRNQRLFLGASSSENTCIEAPTVGITVNTPKTLLTSVCQPSGNLATVINSRDASMTVSSFLDSDDQRFFQRFKEGDRIRFAFIGGAKASGNWVAGNSFAVFGSEASITSFSLTSVDDVYALDMTLTCFSPGDGTGSIFCTFL